MRDQNTRPMLIEAVIAGGLIAIGIPTGGPLATIAAGVGVNWAHSLAERGFQHWRDRWFTEDGVLNHDIAKALCHAFVEAIRQVEHDWRQHRHYHYLRHKRPEQAQLTLDALRLLREDGADLFQQPHLAQVAQQQQHDRVLSLLHQDESKANEYLKPVLAAFLYGHDDEFVTFVIEQFGTKWILRFLEILKGPDEEGTRAWRACQLLWQKSLMLGIEQMQQMTAETADVVQWLQAWAQQLKSLPPTQRNPIGQDALEAILHEVLAQLDEMHNTLDKTYATALDIKDTTLDIKTTLAELAPALPKPQAQPITVSGDRNRQRMLERMRVTWITGVLDHSLHHGALIALGLRENPGALANPWRLVVQEVDHPARLLPTDTRITEVYNEANGTLLILGEPGAGKTTLLLELARDLLARAQAEEHEPLPVVFNLSSWALRRAPLVDFLIEELYIRYQVPRVLGQRWVNDDQLLLLLDGLDEVVATQRSECITAINSYRQAHPLVPVVVCSRSADYLSQVQQLSLQRAVVVQPLTEQQIDDYLASVGEQAAFVRVALHNDPVLQELATTPLMLNILILAYQGVSPEKAVEGRSISARREEIFASYVQHILKRRGAETRYTLEQTTHWLSNLADQMNRQSQTIFYLEQMQPDWLHDHWMLRVYDWLAIRLPGILMGILVTLSISVFIAGSFDPPSLCPSILLGGVLGWLLSEANTPLQPAVNSGKARYALVPRLLQWLLIGLLISGALFSLGSGLGYGLGAGLCSILLQLFLWKNNTTEAHSPTPTPSPNKRTIWQRFFRRREVRNGLLVGLISGLSFGLGMWLDFGLRYELSTGLEEGLIFGLITGQIFGLSAGFLSVLLIGRSTEVQPTDRLVWSWRRWGKSLFSRSHTSTTVEITVLVGLGSGLILGLSSLIFKLRQGLGPGLQVLSGELLLSLGTGLGIGLSYWLLLGLIQGMSSATIEDQHRMVPNQGIHHSALNGLVLGCISIMIIGLLAGLGDGLGFGLSTVQQPSDMLNDGLSTAQTVGPLVGLSAGLLMGLLNGGLASFRHYVLRFLLWRKGSVPWDYVPFLDYAAERILLRRVGGGYIFMHRLLLDYFASLETIPANEESPAHVPSG